MVEAGHDGLAELGEGAAQRRSFDGFEDVAAGIDVMSLVKGIEGHKSYEGIADMRNG